MREPARIALAPIERGLFERTFGERVGDALADFRVLERGEALELLAATVAHGIAELAVEVAEKEERLLTAPLFAHEEERRRWREELNGAQGLQGPVVGEGKKAFAEGAVADLVMVLEEIDEARGREVLARLAARLVVKGG